MSVIILFILLAIALGVSTILAGQMRVLRGMEHSLQAFLAADTGIERALFEVSSVSGALSNGASYQVQLVFPGSDCNALSYCLRSIGSFRDSRRAIEIKR